MTVTLKHLEKIYLENLRNNKCYFDEQQWLGLSHSLHLSKKDFLFAALDFAKGFSQSPISHYKVGALGLGTSNRLYFGTNIEFPKHPLNQSIHAEQSLVSMLYAHQESGLKEIYLTAFPCGHCRQFLRELPNFKEIKIFIHSEKDKSFLLPDLLPYSFGPQDINITESLFLNTSGALVTKLSNIPTHVNKELQGKILSSIKQSFSPYSKNPSGIVLVLEKDKFISGSYIESCAFNPSLSALHMAYAQAILCNLAPDKIKAAYFVELENPLVFQEPPTRNLLQKIAPHAQFFSLKAKY